MKEIDGLEIPLRSLWPTLHCRRVAGVSSLLSIGWWYLSLVSPKRHCCRVSAADKGCRVDPLDPRPDAVALYSGCTPGKRRAWFLPDDRHTAPLVGLRGGWRHARMKVLRVLMDPMLLCPGKGLVLPNLNIEQISSNTRFLLIYLPNNEMSSKSSFAIQKALVGIGGEPKSVKRLRSGDLLIETPSAIQTKSFLQAKTFLNSPVNICPHKTLNSCRGVISEPDLLTTTDAEILDGFSGQEARRLVVPQLSQTYAQAAKSSTLINSIQTDENITKIKFPPLKLLAPLSSKPRPNISLGSTAVTTSSTQAQLLTFISSKASTISDPQPPTPMSL
ncbi:uncharacterized protein TNCV_3170291 [Trichonephila clavipes]|nr:uncharacterized protein TNCV_3170291 [Trichonephila clavipes]